jgi:hypothetical protein
MQCSWATDGQCGSLDGISRSTTGPADSDSRYRRTGSWESMVSLLYRKPAAVHVVAGSACMSDTT